jgi:hypothetical protein
MKIGTFTDVSQAEFAYTPKEKRSTARLPGGSNSAGTQEETHALSHLCPRTPWPVLARAV